MRSAFAQDTCGAAPDLPAGRKAGRHRTVEVLKTATLTPTGRVENSIYSDAQLTLALTTGYHVGPLFIVQKRRAPVIHGGTLGGKRRRARERKNTPPWADLKAIREMYKEAARLTKASGEMHVVDHIVPLDGKLVCGLHWHVNMQVMHWLSNAKKGWRTWPDMPFGQLELL
jgi:hypothetical protein